MRGMRADLEGRLAKYRGVNKIRWLGDCRYESVYPVTAGPKHICDQRLSAVEPHLFITVTWSICSQRNVGNIN